tara:strand:+ start:2962 stop:3531 length:570 start_codon:yes stop_codon:yes gene_type:complete
MSNPISIPFKNKKIITKSHSFPNNFIFYDKNEDIKYSNLLYSMKKLGMKNVKSKSLNSIIKSTLYSGMNSIYYDSQYTYSFNSDSVNSVNSINSNNSDILLEYMNSYISDSDHEIDDEIDHEIDNENENKIKKTHENKDSEYQSPFIMDEILCYSESESDVENYDEYEETFTRETFLKVAEYLLEQDEK